MSRYEGVPDLPLAAFTPERVGFRQKIKLFKGGGGGSSTTEATTYSTNLPEYAEPYFKEMMARTQLESIRPYEPYQDARIADFSGAQQGAQQGILDLQSPAGMQAGQDLLNQAGTNVSNMGPYDPTQFSSNFQARQVDPGTFDSAAAAQYMSPYMQNVVDIQNREALRAGDIQRNKIGFDAGTAGAFGGDRHGMVEAELDRNLMQQMSDNQLKGLEASYGDAQQMFGQDRAARMQALDQQQGYELSQGQMEMSAQQAQEAAKQFGATYEQQQQTLMANIGQSQASIAEAQQALDMARLEAQNAVGAEQQALAQQVLDRAYEDFLNQRDNERQNLAFYNALLRGIPVPTQQEVVQYQPTATSGSQLMGLGIAGLGAYMNQ